MKQLKDLRTAHSYSFKRRTHDFLRVLAKKDDEDASVSKFTEKLVLDGLKARGIQTPWHTAPAYPA